MLARTVGHEAVTIWIQVAGCCQSDVDRHWAIKDAFFTGAGKYLQRIDSDLAERTMLSLWIIQRQ